MKEAEAYFSTSDCSLAATFVPECVAGPRDWNTVMAGVNTWDGDEILQLDCSRNRAYH